MLGTARLDFRISKGSSTSPSRCFQSSIFGAGHIHQRLEIEAKMTTPDQSDGVGSNATISLPVTQPHQTTQSGQTVNNTAQELTLPGNDDDDGEMEAVCVSSRS